jgi:hypothetical protein
MWRVAGALILTAGRASDVIACVCTEFPTFDQAMVAARSVLVGRVVLQGRPSLPRMYPDLDVAYVDVDVIGMAKGAETRARIRVWDLSHGTDCTADMRPLKPGAVIAVAGQKNRGEYREYLSHAAIKPKEDDYLFGGCGSQFELLNSEADVGRLRERLKKAQAREHQ